jgi:hypothetical protein
MFVVLKKINGIFSPFQFLYFNTTNVHQQVTSLNNKKQKKCLCDWFEAIEMDSSYWIYLIHVV